MKPKEIIISIIFLFKNIMLINIIFEVKTVILISLLNVENVILVSLFNAIFNVKNAILVWLLVIFIFHRRPVNFMCITITLKEELLVVNTLLDLLPTQLLSIVLMFKGLKSGIMV